MVTQLKRIARKSKTFIIASHIYDNWRARQRFKAGNIESSAGSTHSVICHFSLPQSVGYINEVFEDYLHYAGFTPEMLRGKRVLEIGHGDNVGVALRFLAAGATEVVCLDKFYSKQDSHQQQIIYKALREQLDEESRTRFDEAVDLTDNTKFNPAKLRALYGTGIEEAEDTFPQGYFDIIVSRGALQSVFGLDEAITVMDRLLVQGGQMWHKMDLSDLGMFRNSGMHPLTFLTVPESVYRLMIKDTGKANRRMIDYYRQKMSDLNYKARFFVTAVVGKGLITPHKEQLDSQDYSDTTLPLIRAIRPSLDDKFRNMTDADLAIAGLFLIATKSARA